MTSKINNDIELLRKAESILQAIQYVESIDSDKAFEQGFSRVKQQRRQQVFNRFVWAAACLSLPLLVATTVLAVMHFFPKESVQMASVSSPSGSVLRYELPDKSVVWLNGGTTLSYPVTFDRKARRVELEGEAYFEVQANPERPFYVSTDEGLSVKVYGTKFNVSAYEEDEIITTTLESGHVDVSVDGMPALALVPGEQAEYSKLTGEMVRSQVNTYEHTAWKDGRMVLRNASLPQIFKALERKFGVKFIVDGTLDTDETFRATFRNESLSQILDYISISAGFNWKMDEGTVFIEMR